MSAPDTPVKLAAPTTAPAEPVRRRTTGDRVATAGQWTLVWWRFRRHKLAMTGLVVTLLIYLMAIFADFVAPVPPHETNARYTYAPPQGIHLFLRGEDGGLSFAPHVLGYKVELDPVALRRTFVIDETKIVPIGLFVKGAPHKVLGLFPTDRHLIGATKPGDPFFLIGADRLGRDVFSRTVHGARISMSLGLVGVTLSLVIGTLLGGISAWGRPEGNALALFHVGLMSVLAVWCSLIAMVCGRAASIPAACEGKLENPRGDRELASLSGRSLHRGRRLERCTRRAGGNWMGGVNKRQACCSQQADVLPQSAVAIQDWFLCH